MLQLVATKRPDDWHVCQIGRPEVWSCGKTRAEAIGNWVQDHGPRVGLAVDVVEVQRCFDCGLDAAGHRAKIERYGRCYFGG